MAWRFVDRIISYFPVGCVSGMFAATSVAADVKGGRLCMAQLLHRYGESFLLRMRSLKCLGQGRDPCSMCRRMQLDPVQLVYDSMPDKVLGLDPCPIFQVSLGLVPGDFVPSVWMRRVPTILNWYMQSTAGSGPRLSRHFLVWRLCFPC